jgi:hypothetical protein
MIGFLRKYNWLFPQLVLFTLVLGTVGFHRHGIMHDSPVDVLSSLYLSLQLFVMNSGGVPGPIPWTLEIARFLAPALTAGGIFIALWEPLNQNFLLFKVRSWKDHVIVCGHHGCGGIRAAMGSHSHGLLDNWLRAVKDTELHHAAELEGLDETTRLRRLVELNVIEQVDNLGKTHIVQQAWRQRARPYIHGWVFDVATGCIDPVTSMINGNAAMHEVCRFQRAGRRATAAKEAR